ncbi:hypothetical protein Rhal01_00606 [Rubritalea halochordaticola]|uniref:Uncharacterized protein n=1 Tax=Rubritalea halochordaticola TaxID=714537 RepID=A0ABP9UVK1_9BACT
MRTNTILFTQFAIMAVGIALMVVALLQMPL